jgi:hypothetical protein
MLRMAVLRQRLMHVEFTKAAAERDVRFARDVLIAKQQYAVVEKRLIDFAEGGFGHRRADIDVAHLRTQRVGEFA